MSKLVSPSVRIRQLHCCEPKLLLYPAVPYWYFCLISLLKPPVVHCFFPFVPCGRSTEDRCWSTTYASTIQCPAKNSGINSKEQQRKQFRNGSYIFCEKMMRSATASVIWHLACNSFFSTCSCSVLLRMNTLICTTEHLRALLPSSKRKSRGPGPGLTLAMRSPRK